MHEKIKTLLSKAGVILTPLEIKNIEITDFGLNDFDTIGLTLHTYVNTERYCAKDLMLLPFQTCPEHRHPNRGELLGKQETFRCRLGTVSLFVEGEKTDNPSVLPPQNGAEFYTVFYEIVLNAGEQYTIMPNIKHWFKAHSEGALISEFSSQSDDASDIFTDPRIVR